MFIESTTVAVLVSLETVLGKLFVHVYETTTDSQILACESAVRGVVRSCLSCSAPLVCRAFHTFAGKTSFLGCSWDSKRHSSAAPRTLHTCCCSPVMSFSAETLCLLKLARMPYQALRTEPHCRVTYVWVNHLGTGPKAKTQTLDFEPRSVQKEREKERERRREREIERGKGGKEREKERDRGRKREKREGRGAEREKREKKSKRDERKRDRKRKRDERIERGRRERGGRDRERKREREKGRKGERERWDKEKERGER
ncbi:hypothetical protein WMY93_012855 [Mugilogobius chulae]|uniref:Uncharacterized protein n=1 Tax=Mugilogobius chulae TaxID=88201 RepID=A0AAW0P4F6_9GOBI